MAKSKMSTKELVARVNKKTKRKYSHQFIYSVKNNYTTSKAVSEAIAQAELDFANEQKAIAA